MMRDMDLIRDLMLDIESGKKSFLPLSEDDIQALGSGAVDEYTKEIGADILEHHLGLIEDAGFVEFGKTGGGYWFVNKITWKGHDFLDSIRDDEIWAKTKESAEAVGGFTVDLLADLAKGFVKTKIKQYTGIDV